MGLHRVETISQHTEREIVEKSAAYYEETKDKRNAMLADYAARKQERKASRKKDTVVLTDAVLLDISQAQRQIDQLETELKRLSQPVKSARGY